MIFLGDEQVRVGRVASALILLFFLNSCAYKNVSTNDDSCSGYYDFIRDHWSQEERYLYKLKMLIDIDTYDNKNEAYLDLDCLEGKDINTILMLFGEPSKRIRVRNGGTIIYCLDKPCLKDFRAGGKYLWINYQEGIVTSMRLDFFPLIHQGE